MKIGLCLSSVRTEVSFMQMVFYDILSKPRNSIFIRFAPGRFDWASGRSSLKSFSRLNGNLELSELLDIVQMCCLVVRMTFRDWTSSGRISETSQTVSTSENRLLVEYWLTEGPDGVALTSGRLQCLSVRHCRASGHLQRPVRTHRNRLICLGFCNGHFMGIF